MKQGKKKMKLNFFKPRVVGTVLVNKTVNFAVTL